MNLHPLLLPKSGETELGPLSKEHRHLFLISLTIALAQQPFLVQSSHFFEN